MYPITETPVPPPDSAASIGGALHRLRMRTGRSLREVAAQGAVTAARLSRIENGHVDPRISTVEAILASLGASLGDLAVAAGRLPDETEKDDRPIEIVLRHRSEIHALVTSHGASNPRVFGSVARGMAGPGSDIDLLVDLESGRTLFDLAALRAELEALLAMPVDVVPSAGLADDIRTEIMAESLAL